MKKTVLFVLMTAFVVSGVIIPTDRIVTWQGNTGVPGGIPSYPCRCHLPANTAWDELNDSLTAADSGQAVCLDSGDGTWADWVIIPSGKVLRGDGNNTDGTYKTRIRSSNTDPAYVVLSGNAAIGSVTTVATLTVNAAKGDTSITVTSSSPDSLIFGKVFIFNQDNDYSDGIVQDTGDEGVGTHYDYGRSQGHLIRVHSKTGANPYIINFDPPLACAFTTAKTAKLKTAWTTRNRWNGIEDLQITGTGHNTNVSKSSIEMQMCDNSWCRNIRVDSGMGGAAVNMYTAYRCEVRDSWFYDGYYYGGGQGYGGTMVYYSTGNLFENNIVERYHGPMIVAYGGAYNIFGYNYVLKGKSDAVTAPGMETHGSHSYMNLWEGNVCNQILFDFTHGSASHQTIFRNRVTSLDSASMPNRYIVRLQEYNRKFNFVGNVFGISTIQDYMDVCPSGCTQASYDALLHKPVYVIEEATATSDPIRHGNYLKCSDGASCNDTEWTTGNSDHNLPNSYYLSGKPAFFGALAWPCIGYDKPTMAGTIPAMFRYRHISLPKLNEGIAVVR